MTFLIIGCEESKPVDPTNFLGNYQRDKNVASDTTTYYRKAIDNSGGWTISLQTADQFTFRGKDTTINGLWSVYKKSGEDHFLQFSFQNDSVKARLNGNIIYFDGPHNLFHNLFDYVIFVKTTETP